MRMDDIGRQQARVKFDQYCQTVRDNWAFQKEEGNPGTFLNGARQLVEGIVGDLLEVLLIEKPDAVKVPREIRKGPLEGKLNALRDNGYMDARLHAHFSILRICGNYGSHRQEADADAELVKTAACSLRVCLKWYSESCLGRPFEVEQYLKNSPSYIKIMPEAEPGSSTTKSRRHRFPALLKRLLAPVGSYVLQILTIVGGTVALYLILNRYGDSLLKLFGMGSP